MDAPIWIEWTCEGNAFTTAYVTQLNAARRVVDLRADDLVGDVEVFDWKFAPIDVDTLLEQFDDEQLYDRT